MRTLLIIGTFEALFLILLILSKREKRVSDLFLGLIFFSFALSIGFTYLELYNAEHGYPFSWVMNISWLFLFLHGPALWFYIKSLSVTGFRFRPVYLLHLVPFLFFLVVHYVSFISLEHSHKVQVVISESFQETLFYKLSVVGIGISTLTYYIWGLKQISDRRRRLMSNFSRIDNKDLEWLRILIIVSLVVYSVNVAMFNLDLFIDIAPYMVLSLVAYSFASIYILVLGFFGLQQDQVFISRAPLTGGGDSGSPDDEYSGSRDSESSQVQADSFGAPDDASSAFVGRLLTIMEKQQPFLDPEITLPKLAAQLQVMPEYLSGILNRQISRSFFDFINRYRVDEFKLQSIAESNRHLSIMGIAYNCGFNSKAAFYRAFRRYEKESPTEYIAGLRK